LISRLTTGPNSPSLILTSALVGVPSQSSRLTTPAFRGVVIAGGGCCGGMQPAKPSERIVTSVHSIIAGIPFQPLDFALERSEFGGQLGTLFRQLDPLERSPVVRGAQPVNRPAQELVVGAQAARAPREGGRS
jgi:hypothetical protein